MDTKIETKQEYLMTSLDVLGFYHLCEQNLITIWIDGGWCVDALLGKQIRDHADLDIALEWKDVFKLREILESRGYKQIAEDSKWNFVLADQYGHSIDFHSFILNEKGEIIDGVNYPIESLTGNGIIDDKEVKCIAPKFMVEFLAPWVSSHPHKYVQAISELCEKFNFPLPQEYLDYVQR
jgi:lincosamide nucleotidyltransferase A/C/D/E